MNHLTLSRRRAAGQDRRLPRQEGTRSEALRSLLAAGEAEGVVRVVNTERNASTSNESDESWGDGTQDSLFRHPRNGQAPTESWNHGSRRETSSFRGPDASHSWLELPRSGSGGSKLGCTRESPPWKTPHPLQNHAPHPHPPRAPRRRQVPSMAPTPSTHQLHPANTRRSKPLTNRHLW